MKERIRRELELLRALSRRGRVGGAFVGFEASTTRSGNARLPRPETGSDGRRPFAAE